MAKAKKPAKPKQSLSRVAKAQAKYTANAASKSQAQLERERAELKAAKLEARLDKAYDKQYAARMMTLKKRQAIQDADRDAKKGKRK